MLEMISIKVVRLQLEKGTKKKSRKNVKSKKILTSRYLMQ